MNASRATTSNRAHDAEKVVGVAEVMTVGVRVAGTVPTRADLRFAGTPEQMLGLSLGTVLIYLNSREAARTVALAWGQAAPLARSLSPVLPAGRRPVMATGPWSLTTMIRLFGAPMVYTVLMPARRGVGLPTMLRMQVGPITWDLADTAAYVSLLNAWRHAADLLAATAGEDD